MAMPLPNEKELYEQIKNEKISIHPDIWDLLYNRIGDDVSAINLLCQYYLNENQPIPPQEAKKILNYTRHIKNIVNDITMTSKEKSPFPEFIDSMPLHPIFREMFTHYIGNDIYGINLIVGCYVDLSNHEAVPIEDTKKIIQHTRTIKDFMNRLKEASSSVRSISEPNKKAPAGKMKKNKEDLFIKIRSLLAKEFKLNEEKIKLESRFNEDLGLDSIDAIQVIMVLESEFNFEIPDAEAEKIFTIAQAVDYVAARLKKGIL